MYVSSDRPIMIPHLIIFRAGNSQFPLLMALFGRCDPSHSGLVMDLFTYRWWFKRSRGMWCC